uniref:uncharacterized protein LOC120345121 n=1 Tax=Styela clava TaxID=7725 RepID=UPI0019399E6E|nr:uncharacterized protein LOC120345121 [Styela clava]
MAMSEIINSSSNTTEVVFEFDEKLWSANVVLNLFGLILSSYVTATMVVHHYVRNSRNKPSNRDIRERRFALIARILCILSAIFTATFSASKAIIDFVEKDARYKTTKPWDCNILFKVANASLLFSSFLAYLFLWTRQRVFYIHKALRPLNSKTLTVTSYVILVLWILYSVTSIVAIAILPRYDYEVGVGCRLDIDSSTSLRIISSSFVVVTALMQVCLLVLFIYPIVKRSIISSQMSRRRSGKSPGSENSPLTRIMWRVKKAIALSVVCIVTDIAAPVIATLTYSSDKTTFTPPYVISLTVNMMCLIFCFDNWHTMLVPCMIKPGPERKLAKLASTQNTSQRTSRNSKDTLSSI